MDRKLSSKFLLAILIVGALALYIASCSRNGSDGVADGTDDEPVLPETDPAIEEFEKRRVDYETTLREMELPALSQEMARDSQAGTEPFNSPAAREIERRAAALQENKQPVEPLAKQLAATLTAADSSSHIGLLTLYEISRPTYYALDPEFRYRVLMDALSKAQVMNAWGVPHSFLTEPAAEAIICEGPAIERYLYPVLDVTRKTAVFGSSEVDRRFKEDGEDAYQVRDYALALIFAVRGNPAFEMPATRAERDGYIERIRKEAAAGGRVAPSRGPEGRGPALPACEPRGNATQTPTQNAPTPQAPRAVQAD